MCRSLRWPQPFFRIKTKTSRQTRHLDGVPECCGVARHPIQCDERLQLNMNMNITWTSMNLIYLHPATRGGRPWLVMSTRLPAKTLDICQLSFSHDRWGYTIPSMDSSESPSATTYNARALGLLRQLIHSWPLTLWAFPQLDILQHADWFRQGHPLQ